MSTEEVLDSLKRQIVESLCDHFKVAPDFVLLVMHPREPDKYPPLVMSSVPADKTIKVLGEAITYVEQVKVYIRPGEGVFVPVPKKN